MVGKKRVERLMTEKGLRARSKRRVVCTTDSKHGDPIAPNVLERRFDTTTPNEAWVGDVTYIAMAQGWLFLAVLLDLFSHRVVGWATSDTNDRTLALAALEHALQSRRPRAGLTHHTDRGSPVRQRGLPHRARPAGDRREHEPYRRLLRQRGCRELLRVTQGRVGRLRALRRPRRRPGIDRRIHRPLLQPDQEALPSRLRQSVEFELRSQLAALAA
jgi:transposase InsO family protein